MRDNVGIGIPPPQRRREPLDHLLLYGPPGLGKTTLAHIIAHEMSVSIRVTSGPAIERAGDLAAILTNLQESDILFIDEVHRLARAGGGGLSPGAEGVRRREVAGGAVARLAVDELGLDEVDHKVLRTIIEKFDGGPVGIETIAASISEEADTIMDVYT